MTARKMGLCVFVGSLAMIASTAGAQNPYSDRPAVSPYLNLLRTDQFGTILPPNYQLLVQPEISNRNALQQQQSQINNLQNQNRRGSPYQGRGGYSVTGNRGVDYSDHRYLNYGHYFPNLGARFAR